jgi:predicted nucleic acid-binding protein
MPKAFLDTNIVAYAGDQDAPQKREKARNLMRKLASDANGVVSTQVLQEYYVVATRKLGIDPLRAKAVVASLRSFETVTVEPDDIDRAIDGSVVWETSFWDALILTAAEKASCSVLFSEDLNAGQLYRGVRVVNPFL